MISRISGQSTRNFLTFATTTWFLPFYDSLQDYLKATQPRGHAPAFEGRCQRGKLPLKCQNCDIQRIENSFSLEIKDKGG